MYMSCRASINITKYIGAASARRGSGFCNATAVSQVRRCHGDLHLRNIVLIEDRPVLFDAIEFDEAIATCDVLYDLAFLLMDLWTRGLKSHANLLFNRYLWICDDVERQLKGLSVLPLFFPCVPQFAPR
jgi:aminoglycoside phosphotransferase family enzyme